MSDNEIRGLTETELAELERRQREGKATLDEEIVSKYDPQRLASMIVRGGGRGERLDLSTRGEMERRLPGYDFGNVRVFRGALAEEVTARHNADAVTIANTGMILVRETGRSSVGTTSGQALLAHELTHVAQAQRGMMFAREHGGGEGAHEHEAESVERGVQHGHHHQRHRETEQQRIERKEARGAKIIARAMEKLEERERNARERSGG